MNELINTTKTYCKICGRFVGYWQKDRKTLKAPIIICKDCKKLKNEKISVNKAITIVCGIALTLAVSLTVIWFIRNYGVIIINKITELFDPIIKVLTML